MASPKVKVVIVGGSIAGLSVANMLQLNNIDFVVLEGYPHIAPQVGASLGLLPHGNRILDQLGLYEKVLALAPPVNHFNFRNEKGVLLAEHKDTAQDFIQRHGYPVLFLDRQMVLQILYENIQDKAKVLTNKRVVKVELEQGGAKAITDDGCTYMGDILIGADGIHSQVRKEMWRLSEKASPGYIPASESTAVPCVYSCIFGISISCPGIEPGSYHSVFRQHSSYLILGGLNSRCYWFCFMSNMKKTTGPDIPRYSKAQEEEAIRAHANDHILPNLTFGDIVARKISSTLTPLEEYVYKKWYFDRILTIGDSCHKFEPISGYGGNAALETAAVFVNELTKSLKESPSERLTTSQIQRLLARTQENRESRAKKLLKDAHSQQRLEAMETPWDRIVAQYLLPRAPTSDVMYNMSRNVPSGQKLNMVSLPARPKWIPYDDELCKTPERRGKFAWFQVAVYLSAALLAYYGMWIRSESYGVFDYLNQIVSTRSLSPATTAPLQTTYTGISAIDETLTLLNGIFVPGTGRFYKSYWMLQVYFLGSLVQPITVWCVESCRIRNHLSLISFVSIWSVLYQLRGVGVLMPVWFAAYTWKSESEHYWWPLSREVPLPYAKAILPAVLIGYVAPTILMFWPWESLSTVQAMTALWQPGPIAVQALVTVFAFLYRTARPSPRHQHRVADAEPQDLRYLRTAYSVAVVLGTVLHLSVVYILATSSDPNLTFSAVFKPNWAAERQTHGEGLRNLWLPDFYGLFVSTTFCCCAAVWDLNRVGLTSVSVYKASIILVVASIVVGPAAAMAGCWYWRELAMAVTAPKGSGNLRNRKEKTT